jgi:uncharacterized protein YfaS (alpha-2-macroglobulin family)
VLVVLFPEKSLVTTSILYSRSAPPARSARRLSVRGPVISQSGAVLPSPGPLIGWLDVTVTILETGAASTASCAVTVTLTATDRDTVLQPLAEGDLLHPGDEVEIHLTIRSKAPAEYVHLRDPRPAGLEPGLAVSGYHFDFGLVWYEEARDSGTNFLFEDLPQGEYTLKYRLRANLAGTFRTGPATLQSMYAPEFTAYSTGTVVRVGE